MINYWHLLATSCVLLFSLRHGLRSAYPLFVLSMSFCTVSLLELSLGGFYLKAPELFFVFVFPLFALSVLKRVDGRSLIFVLIFILPFLLSIIKNLVNFEPIFVWEINAEQRVNWWDKLAFKDGLTSTNFTQFLYVVFSLLVFFMGAHIGNWMTSERFVNALKWSIFIVSVVGILQVACYYSDFYQFYIKVFYNFSAAEYNRLAYHELAGVKRINATFTEPSVYGFYIALSVFVAYLLEGVAVFKSRRVLLALVVGLFSLSGSFYIGVALLSLFVFLGAGKRTKLILVGCGVFFLIPVVVMFSLMNFDLLSELFAQKSASLDERLYYGVVLPLENISKSPWFGFAFGSDRPTTLFFNLLISVGTIGTLLLTASFLFIWNGFVAAYLFFWAVMGFLIPDISLYFAWFYLGAGYALKRREMLGMETRGA